MTFALDSWAVLRLLEGTEPAAGRVEQILTDLRPRLDLDLPSEHRVLAAATIKADHPMAYADAFAAATAAAHDATLLTGDPELLLDGAPWRWEDLRAPTSRYR